jgi:undecaprenyl-diphosphatase
MELPIAAAPASLALVAAAAHARRRGSSLPSIAGAVAAGTAVALATRQSWPVAPNDPAEVQDRRRAKLEPSPSGEGVMIAVNPHAGAPRSKPPTDRLREALPNAEVIELDEPSHLAKVLEEAADRSTAIGAAGGDGSINCAATIAVEHDKPLVVIPAGTLNHFARDLGLESVDDAIEAVHQGEAMDIDMSMIDGRPFLNTASFGAYTDVVDAREKLEDRIGKWPAMVVALIRVLRTAEPCDVELDGRRRRIWMAFIGNCRYHPSGFAPSWRERLDDGLLDVRLVDGGSPFARTRLVFALLTGRLGRSAVYEQRQTACLEVRSCNGPMRLACDGETFDGSEQFRIEKADQRLVVYAPER